MIDETSVDENVQMLDLPSKVSQEEMKKDDAEKDVQKKSKTKIMMETLNSVKSIENRLDQILNIGSVSLFTTSGMFFESGQWLEAFCILCAGCFANYFRGLLISIKEKFGMDLKDVRKKHGIKKAFTNIRMK